MAATGKTPILLYGSTTATNTPVAGNLTNSSDGCEIAINVADKNLFFKDSTNAVNTVPIRQSSGSSDGWLSSANWTTFNSKQTAYTNLTSIGSLANATGWLYNNGSGTFSYSTPSASDVGAVPTTRTISTTSPLAGGGDLSANRTFSITQATTSTDGYLSSTDWNTFNNKQPAGTYVTSVTGTAPVVSSGGTTPAISMAAATGSVNGYLTSTDWTTFNSKQAALVSGTNIKTVSGTTLLGSGDLGTIGVGYGGTGTSTAFTLGSVVFAGASGVYTQDNTNFFWDNTNKRLGIQTATPSYPLQVRRAGGGGSLGISSDNAWGAYTRDALYYAVGDSTSVATGHAFYTRNGSATDVLVGGFDGPGNLQVKVGNVVIGTSGKGIDFSATAGTGTSELLADYEEGTWTPTQGAGLTVVGTFSSAGYYTKVGRLVTVNGYVAGSTSVASASGSIFCGGLPYTAQQYNVGSCRNAGYTTFTGVGTAFSNTNLYTIISVAATTSIAFTITYWV